MSPVAAPLGLIPETEDDSLLRLVPDPQLVNDDLA
jgi:hypothetical protein